MKISARNVIQGNITAIARGAVNAEVELTTSGGDKLVAIVTEGSVKSLGLAVGKPATAYIKAPWVILLTGQPDMRFSARNQIKGSVASVVKGAINSEVKIETPGGAMIYSVITNEAAAELDLKPGVPATALIKASHIILGVPA